MDQYSKNQRWPLTSSHDTSMTADYSLTWVPHNNRIQFATMPPPNSRSVTLNRRMQIVGTPDCVQIGRSGDLRRVANT